MSDLGTNATTSAATNLIESVRETQPTQAVSGYSTIADDSWHNAIANWWNEHVRNSPIAANTEILNHLNGIMPHLKAFVEKELGNPTS